MVGSENASVLIIIHVISDTCQKSNLQNVDARAIPKNKFENIFCYAGRSVGAR